MSEVERNLVYGMHSGLALLMDVYRPEQPKGLGVVYINGSGWHAPLGYDAGPLKETPLGVPYAEAMQAAGYTVFAINHRQAPRFRYPAAIEDAQRAVRFVRANASHWGISADRVGACGGSSGGHLVSLLGTLSGDGDANDPDPVNRESAAVQCVVARAPILDLADCEGFGVGSMVADFMGMLLSRREGAAARPLEEATYRNASPINHVSKTSAPFLLIHGDRDDVVPFVQSEFMLAALIKQGVAAELITIPGAGHGPDFPGAIKPPDYLGAMTHWLDRHLARVPAGAHA